MSINKAKVHVVLQESRYQKISKKATRTFLESGAIVTDRAIAERGYYGNYYENSGKLLCVPQV